MNYYNLTDKAIVNEIGERLKTARINKNMSQGILAEKSGISLRTLQNIESGNTSSKISNIIAIMRTLEILDQLDNFIPTQLVSPIALAEMKGKQRQRASKQKKTVKQDESEW